MSISHWGIVPGDWWMSMDREGFWKPLSFDLWCLYEYGTENEP